MGGLAKLAHTSLIFVNPLYLEPKTVLTTEASHSVFLFHQLVDIAITSVKQEQEQKEF